jgi:hypothetical protein
LSTAAKRERARGKTQRQKRGWGCFRAGLLTCLGLRVGKSVEISRKAFLSLS